MDFAAARAGLDGMEKFGIRPDLSRIEAMLEALGHPERCAPAIHVVGTNGKTSTARFCDSILRRHGQSTGLFTSPHLVSYTERIAINGEPIAEAEFARLFGLVRELADRLEADRPGLGPVTLFEILTAMAFLAFQQAGVSALVIEAGMGGRWDSTNVLAAPVVVITPIGLDHTERLGSTLEEIAAEKAAVIGKSATVVSAQQRRQAADAIEARLSETGGNLLQADRDFPERSGEMTTLGFLSSYQSANAALALVASGSYLAEVESAVPWDIDEAIDACLETQHPGRFQVVSNDPYVILDGAHNQAGAVALASALFHGFPYGSVNLVLAMSDDKDVAGFLRPLRSKVSRLFVCRHSHRRSYSVEALASAAEAAGWTPVRADDVMSATGLAMDQAVNDMQRNPPLLHRIPVVVTGSLFAVGDVLAAIAEQSESGLAAAPDE